MKAIKLIVSFCILLLCIPAKADELNVAAAASLKFAIEEIATLFEQETGQPLRLVFNSSGNFKTQILQGAPFHLFLSADENFVYELADAGKTEDNGQTYAVGRIGIFVPHQAPFKADAELNNLKQALNAGNIEKFAIANPEHAPYGQRAKEALQHAGLWDQIKPKLVYGENIGQAAQFATSGSTQGGIIALSLAVSPQMAKLGQFELIPESWHQPLKQRMVLMKDAPPSAQAFYRFMTTPEAQAILQNYGYAHP
jgi:molybdate transport system substrate-binding protein